MRNHSLFCMVSFLSLAGPICAQTFEIAPIVAYQKMSGEPLGALTDEGDDNDTKFGDGSGYGVRLTWNTPGYYGHEVGYLRSRVPLSTIVRPDSSTQIAKEERITLQQAFYNFMIYFMPAGERWRPFVTGGLQLYQYGAPGFPEWPTGSSRNYGGNYGGGIKLKLVPHALVRFDFRHYLGGKPYGLTFGGSAITGSSQSGGIISQFEGSAGIAITF